MHKVRTMNMARTLILHMKSKVSNRIQQDMLPILKYLGIIGLDMVSVVFIGFWVSLALFLALVIFFFFFSPFFI